MNKKAVAQKLITIARMLMGSSRFQEGDVVYFDKEGRKVETEVKKVIMQKGKWFYEVDKNEEPVAETELKRAASSMRATTGTFKCPNCGTKVLENTGYCVKCQKKVKKAVGESRLRRWEDLTEKFRRYYPRWEVSELPIEVLYHPILMFAVSKYPKGDYAPARNQIEEGYPIGGFGPKSVGTLSDSQYEAIKRDPIAGLVQMRGPDRVMSFIKKINLDTRWSSIDWQKLIYGNRPAVARELLAIARELHAIEFPTQDAYDKYMKEHPDADKSLHRVVETKREVLVKKEEPKKQETKTLSKQEHTHKVDEDTSIRVYDNGGKTADRYVVIIDGKDWESTASPGFKPSISLSEGGRAVSQFGDAKEGKHLGKPVKFGDLDEDTKKHILKRLKESGE